MRPNGITKGAFILRYSAIGLSKETSSAEPRYCPLTCFIEGMESWAGSTYG